MSGILQQVMSNPDQYSIQEITRGMQDGLIPSYVGVPLVAQKTQQSSTASSPPSQQPPIAQQVMQRAQQSQGIPALPTQLATAHAQGGILSFASGGETDDPDQAAYDAKSDQEDQQLLDYQNRGGQDIPDRDQMQAEAYADEMNRRAVMAGNVPDLENAGADSPAVTSSALSSGIAALGGMAKNAFSSAMDHLTGKPIAKETQQANAATQAQPISSVPTTTDPMGRTGNPFHQAVIDEADRQGVPRHVALGVLYNETGANQNAATAQAKGTTSYGPLQINDGVAHDMRVNKYDPMDNIRGGIAYLKQQLNKFQEPKLAMAAYHLGPNQPMSRLQADTYPSIAGFKKGGIVSLAVGGPVKHFAVGGQPDDDTDESTFPDRAWAGITSLGNGIKNAYSGLEDAYHRSAVNHTSVAGELWSPSPNVAPGATTGTSSWTPEGSNMFKSLSPLSQDYSNPVANNANLTSPPSSAVPFTQAVQTPSIAPNTDAGTPTMPDDLADQMRKEMATPVTSKTQDTSAMNPGSKNRPANDAVMDYINQRQSEMKQGKSDDMNMALVAAGMGMMGGSSPFANVNIGQGAAQGLGYLMKANQIRSGDQNQIQAGLVGLSRTDEMAQARIQAKQEGDTTRAQQIDAQKEIAANALAQKTKTEQDLNAAMIAKQGEFTANQARLAAATEAQNSLKRAELLGKANTAFSGSPQEQSFLQQYKLKAPPAPGQPYYPEWSSAMKTHGYNLYPGIVNAQNSKELLNQ